MLGARNIKGGLVLLAVGLAAGLAMSLYSFDPVMPAPRDEVRGLIRLGHVAAIMLPLLNIAFGAFLDRFTLSTRMKSASSWLLLAGAATLPAALFAQALHPLPHLSAAPALAFCAGAFIASWGALRTPVRALVP